MLATIRRGSQQFGGSERVESEDLDSKNRLQTKIYRRILRTGVRLVLELRGDNEGFSCQLGHLGGTSDREPMLVLLRVSRGHRDWDHRIRRALHRDFIDRSRRPRVDGRL